MQVEEQSSTTRLQEEPLQRLWQDGETWLRRDYYLDGHDDDDYLDFDGEGDGLGDGDLHPDDEDCVNDDQEEDEKGEEVFCKLLCQLTTKSLACSQTLRSLT